MTVSLLFLFGSERESYLFRQPLCSPIFSFLIRAVDFERTEFAAEHFIICQIKLKRLTKSNKPIQHTICKKHHKMFHILKRGPNTVLPKRALRQSRFFFSEPLMSHPLHPSKHWLVARKQGRLPVRVVAGAHFRTKKQAQKEAILGISHRATFETQQTAEAERPD